VLGLWVIAPHTKKQFTVAQLLGRARLQTMPVAEASAEDEALARAQALHEALTWAQSDK
jgi:hypothetical protein